MIYDVIIDVKRKEINGCICEKTLRILRFYGLSERRKSSTIKKHLKRKNREAVALALKPQQFNPKQQMENCLLRSTQDTLFAGPLPPDLIHRYIGFLRDELSEIAGDLVGHAKRTAGFLLFQNRTLVR